MREHNCAKSKLGALRYQEQIGDITHEEAEELRMDQLSRIYGRGRTIRGLR